MSKEKKNHPCKDEKSRAEAAEEALKEALESKPEQETEPAEESRPAPQENPLEKQLEEANVFSNTLVIEYVGAGTRG